MTPVQELDSLNCPLRGLFLIEAAAGTGKTYNIQNLVVRAVLERDIPIEKLLVVTYTRAAAAELASRIRQVLSGTLAALEKRLPPESGREAQLVARALETLTSEECRKRLRTALFDFDAATVTTIHGFCQKVLRENAFESGILFSRELDNDCAELLEKLADDSTAGSSTLTTTPGTAPCGRRCCVRPDTRRNVLPNWRCGGSPAPIL